MSDDFLTQFRERPRAEFAEELYQRISRRRGLSVALRWGWATAILILGVVMSLLASPAIRAGALSIIRRIGGVVVEETDLYPGTEEDNVYHSDIEVYTLAEARETLPFDLRLPSWAPSDYRIQSDVEVIHATQRRPVTTVIVTWAKPGAAHQLRLEIDRRRDGEPSHVVTGRESAEAVMVDGTPAALVRGAWDADEQGFEGSHGLVLLWEEDGLAYALRTWDAKITPEELIEMAASVP